MGEFPEKVIRMLCRMEEAGYEAWCVGGAVRDMLRGVLPGDYDIATNARPEQVMALFGSAAIPTGLQHGTVTVDRVEITTFRRDGTYSDRRHPDRVSFTGSLTEDLSRRDFTVNAMAMDRRGVLVDPFGGRDDLDGKILRAVGEPEKRFEEDALRILRGLRFAARLNLTVEERTATALRQCAPLLNDVVPDRIREELTGMLLGACVGEILRSWPDVLGVVLPEIRPSVGFGQHTPYHCYDVWEHTAYSVAASRPDRILRWALLFHDLGKPATFTMDETGRGHFYGHWRESVRLADPVMERLRFDNASRQTIHLLVERHDCELAFTDRAVLRNLSRYGEPFLRLLLDVKRADVSAQSLAYRNRLTLIDRWEALLDRVLAEGACVSLSDLAVRGGDMIALGLRGPAIGAALRALLGKVLDQELPNTRESLLAYAKERLL